MVIVLNNIGFAYEGTVASAQAREDAISYAVLEAFLLGVERRQNMSNMFNIDAAPSALATRCGGRDFQVGVGRGAQAPGRGFHAGVGRGGRGLFQRGRGVFQQQGPRAPNDGVLGPAFNPNGCVQCQICRKSGHSAINCYNRMNVAYEGRVPTPKLQAYATAALVHDSPPMAASPVQNWLFNSEANAHITNDLTQVADP